MRDPEERRRELLACAMRLFAEDGYDNVSVRAVARAAHVAPGLAYHYFDSKERLFAEAIEDYACRCAEGVCAVLDERGPSLDERLDCALATGARHDGYPYADFFHAAGHGALRDRLSLAMCEAVRPHLRRALEADAAERGPPRRTPTSSPPSWSTAAWAWPPARARRTRRPSRRRGATSARLSPSFGREGRQARGLAPAVAGASFCQLY